MADLTPLFAPRAVAILGVSRNPAKLGHRLLQNVKTSGYAGAVHPVNPSGEPILGCATVPTPEALPEGIDLALVSLPAPAVPEAVRALAARRVRIAVVLTSGFAEAGPDGDRVQAELLAAARAAGLRLVGPNCMGVYSAPASLNGTYFWDLPRLAGGIGVVSQSGAYGGLIIRHLGGRGLGVTRFLSIGNQVDIDVAEVIEYFVDDPATTLIACFVEGLRDGQRFVAAAARAVGRKPVVVLKGGRSEAGRRAAGSHTGALAGADELFRAACLHAGAVPAEDTDEFLDAIETLAHGTQPRPAAPRVAIVTVSGGPSVVAADCAERSGLTVPPLADEARATLRGLLPAFAAVGNPVDLTPQVEPARIARAMAIVFGRPEIAGVVAVNVGLDIPEFADGIVAAARSSAKPAVAFTVDAPAVTERLKRGGVPVLPSPERAVRAWRALWRSPLATPCRFIHAASLPGDLAASVAAGQGPLPAPLARRLLEAYGVRFCREATAGTVEEALAAAGQIGYPVVVKAEVPGLTHKTDVGGVDLDVRAPHHLRRPSRYLPTRTGARQFLVQERLGPGVELLLGARRDEVYGPAVAVGAGGVLTEVIREVALRLAPLAEEEIAEMLREGALPRLLAGPRGLPAVEVGALGEAVRAMSDLIVSEPRVLEVDVNPLIAAGSAVIAVDALVIVGGPHRRPGGGP